jgi:SH3-like domain-containing protein
MEATLLAATSRVTDTSTPNATQTSGAIMTQTAQFNATGTTVSGLQTAQAVSNASATANAQADLQPLEMTQLARLNAQQAQSATEINGVTKVPNTGEITFPTASLTDDLSPTTDAVLTVTPSATATPTATATRTPTPTQTPSPTIAPAQTPTAALVSPTASPTETDTPQPVSTLPPVAIVSGTQSINLRAGAGTTFTIITALQPGTSLIILEQDNTTGWTKVRMGDGREGWVSSTLLRVVGTATPVPTSVSGEVTGCPAVVQQIINSVSAVCSGLARNTACYAHDTVNASLLQPTRKLVFNAPGDQIDIAELSSLQLSKYNTDTGDWGIVILNVESTFADALPGASVTVILAGEGNPTTKQFSMDQSGRVNVSYNIEPQYGSIQAYYLVPGVSSPQCRVLPASLIIQSPQGAIKLDIASDRIVFTSDPAK